MTTNDHEMVMACLPIAQKVAWKYCIPTTDILDLQQDAMLGVCKAVKEYNPKRGKFSAIAYYRANDCVRESIVRNRLIRFPRRWELQKPEEYGFDSEREPPVDVMPVFDTASDRELCGRLLSLLSPMDQEIIRLRFWEGKWYREIGEIVGLTESGALFRVRKAIDTMRRNACRV